MTMLADRPATGTPNGAAAAESLRAAIYCRVSTQEQGEHGYSLDAQAGDCRKLGAELDATIAAEFRDVDSGASWDLPGLNAMLDAAKRRDFDVLLCYDLDRLARRMAKQLVIEEELKRSGVTIKYVTLKLEDTAEDRLLKNVRSSIAEYEREKIAFRTGRGRRAKAEMGLVVGTGVAPYGYRYLRDGDRNRVVGLEPDPATAPVAERIFRELIEYPVNAVCDRLNAEGVPTYLKEDGRWVNSTILGIVDNPAYRGRAGYGRRDTHKKRRRDGGWPTIPVPALVDEATYRAVREALERRRSARSMRKEGEDPYLLRGRLVCGHCGGLLACIPNNGYRYYTCLRSQPTRARRSGQPTCTLPPVPAEGVPGRDGERKLKGVEDDVHERVSAFLLDPARLARGLQAARAEYDAADRRRRERMDTLAREIAKLTARLQRITAERMDSEPGSLTDQTLKDLGRQAEQQIGRLQAERAQLDAEPEIGLGPESVEALEQFAAEVREGLDLADPSERRKLYTLLRLRGTARLDPEHGEKLGRRHRFSIAWDGAAGVLNGGREYKKTRVRYFTPEMAEWEAKYLEQPVGA